MLCLKNMNFKHCLWSETILVLTKYVMLCTNIFHKSFNFPWVNFTKYKFNFCPVLLFHISTLFSCFSKLDCKINFAGSDTTSCCNFNYFSNIRNWIFIHINIFATFASILRNIGIRIIGAQLIRYWLTKETNKPTMSLQHSF